MVFDYICNPTTYERHVRTQKKRHNAVKGIIAPDCALWRIFVLVCGRILLTSRGIFFFTPTNRKKSVILSVNHCYSE